jgi:hypothetical protein
VADTLIHLAIVFGFAILIPAFFYGATCVLWPEVLER